MVDFKMSYRKNTGITNNEGIVMETYGIVLTKQWEDGREEIMEIPIICHDEKKIDWLLALMKDGFVTPMTAYEIVEDFLEM